MKTLTEAMAVIESNGTPEDDKRVESEGKKFEAIIREIVVSEDVYGLFVSAMYVAGLETTRENFRMWVGAFADGVKIGMEMEKP